MLIFNFHCWIKKKENENIFLFVWGGVCVWLVTRRKVRPLSACKMKNSYGKMRETWKILLLLLLGSSKRMKKRKRKKVKHSSRRKRRRWSRVWCVCVCREAASSSSSSSRERGKRAERARWVGKVWKTHTARGTLLCSLSLPKVRAYKRLSLSVCVWEARERGCFSIHTRKGW